jgi:hypothetical protein
LNDVNASYDVLSPWAEVDPKPRQGISPRLSDLRGKRIGLYQNFKAAAGPIQDAVERELRTQFGTDVAITRFAHGVNDEVAKTDARPRFEAWLREVDAVIVAVGD